MSSASLKSLIKQFPREREAIKELEALLNEAGPQPKYEFTQERFFSRFSLSPSRETARFLAALENMGVVHKIFRVESKAGGGIGDYTSILEVPQRLHDFRTDTEITVEPGDLHVLYTLETDQDGADRQ